ncbi:uncharacterized protein LOC128217335 [Mya arenaria]|uniref:uncharacterized protein LOC128217335 n=1 Tax=Mya arenaria TaxID=6604 RepID=UPI0022E92F81|nr:uncharacterized protein LOC128217335 [Mya arenaria]
MTVRGIFLFVVILLPACFGRHGKPKLNFKALTFNTGLLGVVEQKNPDHDTSREDRRDVIIEAVRSSNADVVCLQEISKGTDIEAFVRGLANEYPHSQSQLHLFNGQLPQQAGVQHSAVCSAGAAAALVGCAFANNCAALLGTFSSSDEFVACLETSCGSALQNLIRFSGQSCLTCLSLQVAIDVTKLLDVCASPVPSEQSLTINPMGLLLLSKQPLTVRQSGSFYPNIPQFLSRGYLRSKFVDKVTVVCTHLIPPLSDVTNPEVALKPFFPTLVEQSRSEITTIVETFKDVRPLLLLGDFNVNGGPLVPGKAFGEDQYRRLSKIFNTQVTSNCTFCDADQNVYNFNSEEVARVVDFIFGNGLWIRNVKRVFTPDEVSIPDNGERVPLSDHFGVMGDAVCSPGAGRMGKKGRKRM